MSIIWRKVWRDLWDNKLRTLLVIMATAVGIFAIGSIFGSSGMMRDQMTRSHVESNAPHITFYTSRFQEETLDVIRREPGVAAAEGEATASFRWRLSGEADWRQGMVFARQNPGQQAMYPIELMDGQWPDDRTLAVERMSASYFDLPPGTTIEVDVGRYPRPVELTSRFRHPYTPPPQIGMGNATFLASPETVAWLTGEEEGLSTINLQLDSFSQEKAEAAVEQLKDRLETMGIYVGYHEIVDPGVHWGQEMIDAVYTILTILGLLSLSLSGFMIINVMNATIVQQVWQIGVMKVFGATKGRVIRIYLATALIYGLLSLTIAVPLGALATHFLSVQLLDLFNIIVHDFQVVPAALGIQFITGLAVPVISAAIPVLGGVRVSPHEAINTHGLRGSFGHGVLDRLLGRIRSLPRPLALSLRNTFRHKARITLTLIALLIGGAMFMMVLSVSDSFTNTVNVLLDDFGFDALVLFDRPYHIQRLIGATEDVDGVTDAEVWGNQSAQLELKNGEALDVGVWGVPQESAMFSPRIAAGRPLLPGDEEAILLNHKIATDEEIDVGETITLTIGRRESTWTVVGLIVNINNNSQDNFVPFTALAEQTGNAGHGSSIMITGDGAMSRDQEALIEALRAAYKTRQIGATYFQSANEVRETNAASFDVIVTLMVAMALLSAAVGGIGLASTMAINVVERRREIGVMRATGATSQSIVGIFVVEGVLIGAMSWLLATPVSYPGAQLMSRALGQSLLNLPLDFTYSIGGMALWLALVLTISALASLWPALRATKVSVRESLAYE